MESKPVRTDTQFHPIPISPSKHHGECETIRNHPRPPWQETCPHLTPCLACADSVATIAQAVTEMHPVSMASCELGPSSPAFILHTSSARKSCPARCPAPSLPLWLS